MLSKLFSFVCVLCSGFISILFVISYFLALFIYKKLGFEVEPHWGVGDGVVTLTLFFVLMFLFLFVLFPFLVWL